MNMNNPFGSIAGGINDTVDAYRSNPGPLNKELQQNAKKPLLAQSLIKLMAAELINKEQAAKENELRASMKIDSRTVADKTYEQLYGKKEQEIANRVAMVEQGKQLQKRKAMDNLTKRQGIGALPTSLNQRPTGVPTNKMAGGGVVAFQPGGEVEVEPYTLGDAFVDATADVAKDVAEFAAEYPTLSTLGGVLAYEATLGKFKPIKKAYDFGKNTFYKIPKELYKQYKLSKSGRFKDAPKIDPKTLDKDAPYTDLATVRATDPRKLRQLGYSSSVPLGIAEVASIPADTFGIEETAKEEKEKPKADPPPLIDTGATGSSSFDFDVDKQSKLYENKILGALTGYASDQASTMGRMREMQDNEYYSPEAIQNRAKEREAKIKAGQEKVLDARDRGIAALKEGFATENTARENAIKTMQANVDKLAGRGEFEKAANYKDFLAALSTVGAGRNLGEGLGLGFRTLYNREDARARRAERGDKEIAALKLDNAQRVNDQARDIFGIESDKAELIQQYLTEAQGREDATGDRMLAAQKIQNELVLAIEGLRGKVSTANLNAMLNIANNRTELIKTAVSREGIATQNKAVLAGIFGDLVKFQQGLITELAFDDTEEARAGTIRAELESVQGMLNNLASDLGITGP